MGGKWQDYPERNSECTTQMGHGGIDADDQIQLSTECGTVGKVSQLVAQTMDLGVRL